MRISDWSSDVCSSDLVNRRSPGDGDNLYLSSIVALDADTGQYVWHYQTNPREAWDYKCTANMIAATLKIGGKPRKVLMQAPTNGRSEEHTSELQSLMRISYAVFCLKKKIHTTHTKPETAQQ